MNKVITWSLSLFLSIALLSCGSKQSASSIAQKWCDLNGKAHRAAATGGAELDKAQSEVKKFENEMEAKYKNDPAFMKEIERETEKCEAASEGR